MRKIRVTGRFYVFLMLVTVIVLFIFRDSLFGSGEIAAVYESSASDIRTAQAVIVRNEQLASAKQVSRMEFIAEEKTLVNQGDPVAYVYSLEYSEKLIRELSNTRKNIQSYHNILLGNELDSTLEVKDLTVKQLTLDLKNLVRNSSNGNFNKLVERLEDAMEDRRQYMSSTMRSDAKLIKYYDEEKQKISAIDSWRKEVSSPAAGVVSFYLDGYESTVNSQTINTLNIDQLKKVLAGEKLSGSQTRSETDVFRVVDQNSWSLMVLSTDTGWNPVVGQMYSFQMVGFEDLVYTGTVARIQKSGTTIMAQLNVTDPIGPLMYQRSGSVALGANLTGLRVPSEAIVRQNDQTGVLLYDVPGGTFIPVEVLSDDGDNALILPLVEGVIGSGSHVLIK